MRRTNDNTAFLSVRVPESVRNRMKAIAAARGERLQDLIGGLIARFLEEAERKPPELAGVVSSLREREAILRGQGVAALWVFGSVARGDARPDSDVDLAIEFTPETSVSLFDIARLQADLEEVLARAVDLGERSAMTQRVAAAVQRELVRVF
jgi:predicted nucleotidyltransferase